MSALTEKLFVGMQYVLPARLIGALTYRLARSRQPWLKNLLINGFTRLYAINEADMDRDRPTDYPSFNAFFTRELKGGARPVDPGSNSICSPADGTVQQAGRISDRQMIQAKGMHFSLNALLHAGNEEISAFENGAFTTIYLAPHNYHRVHAPLAGALRRMHFIPGARFSVNSTTADAIPGLFARNERVACQFDSEFGPFWLVFVGAMNVSSVSTAWAGEIAGGRTPRHESWPAADAPAFDKGEYIGHFNLGSTIVMTFPNDCVNWTRGLLPGDALQVGAKIGTWTNPG